jgi:Isochorismatase family
MSCSTHAPTSRSHLKTPRSSSSTTKTGVRDYSTGELKHNVVALAKAAKALKLPIIITTTARDSMWGPTFPELVEALPGVSIIDRSSVNAFDDAKVAQAITATGRKKLIFAGIALAFSFASNPDTSRTRDRRLTARPRCKLVTHRLFRGNWRARRDSNS